MLSQRKRPEQRKTRILKAAEELLSRDGFHATTVDRIAERAQEAKGSVYYYFQSKGNLYLTILLNASNAIVGEMEGAAAQNLPAAEMATTLHRVILVRSNDRNADVDWNEIAPRLINTSGAYGEKFKIMVGNFYEKLGWDRKTGIPTRATLEALGLKDVADDLQAAGKLPAKHK